MTLSPLPGVHFNTSYEALKYEISTALRVFAHGVEAFVGDRANADLNLSTSLSCAGMGEKAKWAMGDTFYKFLKNVSIDLDSSTIKPPLQFNQEGMLKAVELQIMNLRPGPTDRPFVWEQVTPDSGVQNLNSIIGSKKARITVWNLMPECVWMESISWNGLQLLSPLSPNFLSKVLWNEWKKRERCNLVLKEWEPIDLTLVRNPRKFSFEYSFLAFSKKIFNSRLKRIQILVDKSNSIGVKKKFQIRIWFLEAFLQSLKLIKAWAESNLENCSLPPF